MLFIGNALPTSNHKIQVHPTEKYEIDSIDSIRNNQTFINSKKLGKIFDINTINDNDWD